MIHFFNPGHEVAVLNASPYYTARTSLLTMQRELAFLPAWYADEGDWVLVEDWVEDAISDEFIGFLKDNIHFDIRPMMKKQLRKYRKEGMAFWGIAPQAIYYFECIAKEYDIVLPLPTWNDRFVYLNSRKAAHDCLTLLCERNPLLSEDVIPHFCYSTDEVEKYVDQSSHRLLAKAPYSSSGRGLLWLPVDGLTRTERQILHGMIKKQEYVTVERVLDKRLDFAMEFESDGAGNVQFIGYSLFYTNEKGAYKGNYIGSQSNIEATITSLVPLSLLEQTKADLITILSEMYASHYAGCIGVDMLIYDDANGKTRLQPCIEINMRSNMGLLALRISERYVALDAEGKFYLDFMPQDGAIFESHTQMQEQHPPRFVDGKLQSGYLTLCPIAPDSHYRAYLLLS